MPWALSVLEEKERKHVEGEGRKMKEEEEGMIEDEGELVALSVSMATN
jgi:hypothetical protein